MCVKTIEGAQRKLGYVGEWFRKSYGITQAGLKMTLFALQVLHKPQESWKNYLKCLNFRGFKFSREFNFADATYFLPNFVDLNFADFADYLTIIYCSLLL